MRRQMYIPSRQSSFWEGLLGGFLQANGEKQDEQRENDAYMGMIDAGSKISNMNYNPANPQQQPGLFNTNPDITKPLPQQQQQQQNQGLLSGNISLTTPIDQQSNANILTQPITQANAPISKPEITQQPAVQKQPTLQEMTSFYKQQIPAAMKELTAKYGKKYAKEIYGHLTQTVNDKIMQVTDQYNRNQQEQAYQVLGSDADYKTKFMAGVRAGMKPELLKMALDNGIKIDTWNNGSSIIPVAIDSRNQRVIDMTTGQAITPDRLNMQMNPYQRATLDQKERDMVNKASGAYYHGGGGGGRSGNGKINGMTEIQMGNEISNFKKWKAKNPDLDDEEYPRYDQYLKAADPYGNYNQADQIADSIDDQSGDPENTFQYLYKRLGYGQGG